MKPGEFITIYCTGLGAVSNPPTPGKPASNNPLSMTLITPKVTIGGQPATVSFSGLSPGFVGLYQVNAQIPDGSAGGSAVSVTLSLGGVESNTVTIAVAGPVGVSKIAGGSNHTCAVTNAGAVLCWGRNANGQLGNGTTSDSVTPVPVTGLTSGVIGVAAGPYFTCALTKAGTVWCWGIGGNGNLGNGAMNESHVPVQVLDTAGSGPLSGVVQISTGQAHVCAVTSGGAALCWGDNFLGAIGNNSTLSGFPTPQQVSGLASGVAEIAAGDSYTCAVTTAGAVLCWGGSLVSGGGNTLTPIAVSDPAGNAPLTGVAAISTGFDHACVLTNAGTELCWGANGAGGLGNGTMTDSTLPAPVLDVTGNSPLSSLTEVTAAYEDSCALTSAGGVLCWGYNANGEIGDGGGSTTLPVQVTGLTSGVTEIASGYRHNCAILSNGGVMCWGLNVDGEIGNGKTNAVPTPVAVVGVGGTGLLKLF